MNIRNFHGTSVLMEETGGVGGGTGAGSGTGGGDSTALTVSTGTAVADAPGGSGGELSPSGDSSLQTGESLFDASGRMTPTTSKLVRELETANPAARSFLGRAQRALGAVAKLTSMLGPKYIDAIVGLRRFENEARWADIVDPQARKALGKAPFKTGQDGLAALRSTAEDMERSDELYAKSDPQLLAMMTETPAAKQAYVKLWPHSVSKLRDLAPLTYTKWLGDQVLSLMEKSAVSLKTKDGKDITEEIDLPRRLRRMVGCLPWTTGENGAYLGGAVTPEQAQTLAWDIEFLNAFLLKVRGYASQTPEDLTPSKEDASAARIAEAERRADAATEAAWVTTRNAECNELIRAEVEKQAKGLNLSATEIANVTAKARATINEYRRSRPDNNSRIAGFKTAKNLAGYLTYNKGIVEEKAPEAVEKALASQGRRSSRRAPIRTAAPGTTSPATGTQQQADTTGKIVGLTSAQAQQLRAKGTLWMMQKIGNQPGTTQDMIGKRQWMLKKGNPLNLPEGSIVQFPVA